MNSAYIKMSDETIVYMPDTKIESMKVIQKQKHKLHAYEGAKEKLAVFSTGDLCVGWAPVAITGYPDVQSWKNAVKYRGYKSS